MILNLVYPDKSDIQFDIISFPDGQQDVVILGWKCGDDLEWEQPILAYPVTIKSRFNSFKDLELIVCAKKALDKLGFNNINLYIPYLLGARSDRQFQTGGTSYLVDVIAPIINSLEFDEVIVMDVHSDVAAACIKNLKVIDNINLVEWSLTEITINNYKDEKHRVQKLSDYLDNCVLISPDSGSLKKIYKVADAIGYKGDIICCSKSRDTEGKLSKVNVPIDDNTLGYSNKDFIILDDICDGGATFINISKEINRKMGAMRKGKIYLIVTHSILSKGTTELGQYFDGIYCTNSYKDIEESDWLTPSVFEVKQLNVF